MPKEIGSFLYGWRKNATWFEQKPRGDEIRVKFPFESSFVKGYYLNHISILPPPYQLHKEIHWEVGLFQHFICSFVHLNFIFSNDFIKFKVMQVFFNQNFWSEYFSTLWWQKRFLILGMMRKIAIRHAVSFNQNPRVSKETLKIVIKAVVEIFIIIFCILNRPKTF